jgi:16S rRNA (guanine527-N7)-methyltransferase
LSQLNQRFLKEGLVKLGLEESECRILPLLERYVEEIELFNPAYGLVKVRDRRELIVKHILDSLAPIEVIRNLFQGRESFTVADVGSGAGLPGIPLAVCLPNAAFTLIERMGRRAGFLRDAVAVLGLSNITVEEAEMEKLAPAAGNCFDLIVFRAFKPLDGVILKGLFALLKPTGILAAYKGRRQAIEEEMAGLQALSWEVIPLEVPFLVDERHLLLIKPNANSMMTH